MECTSTSLNVDSGIWLDDMYVISDQIKTLTWNLGTTGKPECGNVIWELEMMNSSQPDSSVFTANFAL